MSARDDYPLVRALDALNGGPSALDEIDRLRVEVWSLHHLSSTVQPGELWCPSVDVCGWCGDSECGGIACIAALDPDRPEDAESIEQLHGWLRRGQLAEQAERFLAIQENRASR